MRRYLFHVMASIAMVLAAGYYWQPGGDRDADPATVARQKSLPKTYVTQTRSWLYNSEGELTEVLEAASAERFSPGDISELEAPRYYSHNGDDRTWAAIADRGRVTHNNQILTLYHNVLLTNDQTGGRLETQEMSVNTHSKTAISKVSVVITQGENSTRADGMRADLNLERILLTPNVESLYRAPAT